MKMECKKLDSFQHSQKCAFCCTSEVNEDKLGPIYMHKNIITHYFCLLLSSNMEQNGRDSDGILGFLYNDIQKEIKRGQRLYCTYCKHKGATLGCSIRKCRTVFHLPCGLHNDSLHQFFGQFRSYCSLHRPRQEVDEAILAEARKQSGVCAICCESIVPYPTKTTLWAPCCKKNAWFHRDCIQRMAISFGYFFKCPLCNNKDMFQDAMKYCGIYIPEQDASWEVVPNAFGELYQRHDTCDAENCTCPKGRRGNYVGTRWELVLCSTCGSQGIHIGCGRLKWTKPEWHCPACSAVVQPKSATDREENHQSRINEQKKDSVSRTRSSISSTKVKEDESSSSEYNSYIDNSSDEERRTRSYYAERGHRHRQKKRLYKRSRSPPMLRQYTAHAPSASHRSQSPPVLRDVCTSPPRPFSPFRKSHVHERAAHPLRSSSPLIAPKSHTEFSPLPNKSSAPSTSTVPTIIVDDDDDDDDDVVMIVDDSPDDVLITKDGSRIKVIPMKENIRELKSVKAEGDPSIEEIIECNIQIKCDTSKRKSESSSVNTSPYVTGLAQNKSVFGNVQTVCSVEGVQTYGVPVHEYNMSTTSFAAEACIVNSDSCRQNGFFQPEVPQHSVIPVWQDAQQKSYMNTPQQQRKLASSSKRSSVSIDSDISEHRAANSCTFRSSKRPRRTEPAGATETNKENAYSESSSSNPKKKACVKPRGNRNRLNPCVVLTPLKFTVTDGKVEILYEPKMKHDEVETKKSVRKRLKFDSDLNSKQYVKVSSKQNRVIHSVKSKVNKVNFEHNRNYVNSNFAALDQAEKNKIKIKSEGKLKKRQELKTKKNKTNKILFNFFNKHKTAVDGKSKYQLTNKISAYLEPKTYEKHDVTSEVFDDMKYKQQTGDSEFKSNEIFTFKKILDAKTYSTDSNLLVNIGDEKQESKLENVCVSTPSVLFESTNCNRDKLSSLKEGKVGKEAIESNICSQNKKVKGNKNGKRNKEFVRAKETSKENFDHLKSLMPKVKNKGKLDSRYVIGKPSFKVKLISKGSIANKHKKQLDKIKTEDVKFPETKQNNDLVTESEYSCENETSPERKPALECKVVTESKASRCLCSYFKMTCNHCSGLNNKKVIIKEEPEVAKKQTKEKTSAAESGDSSQLKLSFSSSGFCLTRVV